MSRQLSPMVGQTISRLLNGAPMWTRPIIWPEPGRIGLDPDAAEIFCVRWRGKRVPVAFFEKAKS